MCNLMLLQIVLSSTGVLTLSYEDESLRKVPESILFDEM